MEKILIDTSSKCCFFDITDKIEGLLKDSGVTDGFLVIYVPHTTAGIMINENADPSVGLDIRSELERLVPDRASFKHVEGNSTAHIKSVLTGNSSLVMIENKRLMLGTWQGIFFMEFDGPRNNREIWIKFFSSNNK